MSVVRVQLAARKAGHYDIHIEPGLFDRLGELVVRAAPAPSAVVISDSNVGPLYGAAAVGALSRTGFKAELFTFCAGEERKTLATVSGLWDSLAHLVLERASPVVAVGGGVVGDVAGFVAACYLRGLPVVQVPTTLLACVDSSVGGKTGIDHPAAGKNMIGAFHQPVAVLIDPLLLATLPPREWSCGLAESVKHGLILDGAFFDWLEQHAGELADLAAHPGERVEASAGQLARLIERNCRLKAQVVSADELESGLREVLNFGHTIGHALEALGGYGKLRHGEAVSIGMVVETRMATARGLAKPELLDRLVGLLRRLGLPTTVPADVDIRGVLTMTGKDKKVRGGKVRFVLPTAAGHRRIVDDVSAEQVAAAIEQSRREA